MTLCKLSRPMIRSGIDMLVPHWYNRSYFNATDLTATKTIYLCKMTKPTHKNGNPWFLFLTCSDNKPMVEYSCHFLFSSLDQRFLRCRFTGAWDRGKGGRKQGGRRKTRRNQNKNAEESFHVAWFYSTLSDYITWCAGVWEINHLSSCFVATSTTTTTTVACHMQCRSLF